MQQFQPSSPGSPGRRGLSPTRPNSLPVVMSIGEKEGELEKLSKENFNMKLRIFYLEERLTKLRKGGETDESLQQENFEMKLLVDEKQQEIDERNNLLHKARNAIESLHTDLALCKAELNELRSRPTQPDNQQPDASVLEEKDAEIKAHAAMIRSLEDNNRKQYNQLVQVTERNQELHEKIKVLDEKLLSGDQRHVQLDKESKLRCEEIEYLKDTIASLETQLQGMEQTDAKFRQAQTQIEEYRKENKTLNHELVEMSKQVGVQRARQSEIKRQAEEVAKLEADEISRLQSRVKQLEQDKDEQTRARAHAEYELENKCRLLEAADSTVEELEKRISATVLEANQLQKAHHDQFMQSTKEHERMLKQIRENFAQQTDSLRDGRETLYQQLSSLETANQELEETLKKANNRLAEQEDTLTGRISELETVSHEHDQQLTSANREVESLRKQLEDERMVAEKAQINLVERHRVELAKLQEDIAALQHDREEVVRNAESREQTLRTQIESWESQVAEKLQGFSPMKRESPAPRSPGGLGAVHNLVFGPTLAGMKNDTDGVFEPLVQVWIHLSDALNQGANDAEVIKMASRATTGEVSVVVQNVVDRLAKMQELKRTFAVAVKAGNANCEQRFAEMHTRVNEALDKLMNSEVRVTTLAKLLKIEQAKVSRVTDKYQMAVEAQQGVMLHGMSLEVADTKLAESRQQIENLYKDNAELSQGVTRLEESLRAKDMEVTMKHQQMAEAQKLLDEYASVKGTYERKLQSIRAKFEDKSFQLEAARTTTKELQRELNRVTSAYEKLHHQIRVQDRQIEEKTRQLDALCREKENSGHSRNNVMREQLVVVNEHQQSRERFLVWGELQSKQDLLADLVMVMKQLVVQTSNALDRNGPDLGQSVGGLLKTNSKLARKLERLGHDLQIVYQRFKVVEKAVMSSAGPEQPAWHGEQVHETRLRDSRARLDEGRARLRKDEAGIMDHGGEWSRDVIGREPRSAYENYGRHETRREVGYENRPSASRPSTTRERGHDSRDPLASSLDEFDLSTRDNGNGLASSQATSLHAEMLARLSRIGGDLKATAQELNANYIDEY